MNAWKKPTLTATNEKRVAAQSNWWRPPLLERTVVAIMGGLLSGSLACVIVYMIVRHGFGGLNPLLQGFSAAVLCFLAVALIILFASSFKIPVISANRVMVSLTGAVLAGILGLFIGHDSVWDPMLDRYIRIGMHRVPYEVEVNAANASLAGYGVGAGCGTISGISLLLLLDRRDGQQAKEAAPMEQKEEEGVV
jgi:hypothetical protein